jgi:cytoskeletal protein CcmA (bactofilin family)/DNA-directed RNA polymerase subunit RPC12/RpoP
VIKSPAKANVECPHCGFKQMEYAAAKSTICRQCGRSFNPSAPKTDPKFREKEEISRGASPFKKLDNIWNRRGTRVVACFECKRKHEVSDAATSTNCPGCSAHIDLRDYKITTTFSRSIRTRGELHLTSKGDLSSTSVICRSALIEGKLRGNLQCDETVTVNYTGKIPGRIVAKHITVEKKSDVQCFRRLRVETIDIKGRMSGGIVATGAVIVHKTGVLEGSVTAKSIAIEKGGTFSGQLVIGEAALTQGELLPAEKSESGEVEGEPNVTVVGQPLPAT